MARLASIAFDGDVINNNAITPNFEGLNYYGGSGSVSYSTAVKRTGSQSAKFDTGLTSGPAYLWFEFEPPSGRTTHGVRAYLNFSSLPSQTVTFLALSNATSGYVPVVSIRLTSGGYVQGYDSLGNSYGSVGPIATGEWHSYEVMASSGGGQLNDYNAWVDEQTLGYGDSLDLTADPFRFAFIGAILPTDETGFVGYIDDVVIHTDGTPRPSSKIAYLLPTSDYSIGNWTGGAGGTTSLFEAINNLPPAGLAPGSATNTSQVKSSTPTSNYDVTLQSYTAAGIPSNAVIRSVQQVVIWGSDSTSTLSDDLQILDNPAQGSARSVSSGRGQAPVAYPGAGWTCQRGVEVVNPSVNLSSTVRVRVGHTGGTNQPLHCCLTLAAVEYEVPATIYVIQPPIVR